MRSHALTSVGTLKVLGIGSHTLFVVVVVVVVSLTRKNTAHVAELSKTAYGCRSGWGIENGHLRDPTSPKTDVLPP